MFAYHKTEEAPARFDEATQTYVPIDDKVILRKKCWCLVCTDIFRTLL